MSLTRTAIDKNRITAVALVVMLLAGVQAYTGLPRAEDPGFIIRTATVVTHFPGASPERVEQLVTDRLEKAIQEMPELDFIGSQSKTGVSILSVNVLESYTDMRPIWDSLRRKVERVASDLPAGIIGPTVNDEFGDVFGTLVALTGDGYTYAELKDISDEVRDELLLLGQVAKVEIHGAQDERIFVEYNNARLAELGLSPGQLQSLLEARNIIIPGGEIRTPNEKIVLEPTGNFESVDDLRRTVINLGGGANAQGQPSPAQLIFLEDVANIYRGYVDPPRTRVRVNGEPGLVLAVSMREGGNILDLGLAVTETVERLQAAYPHGIELSFAQYQAAAVEKKIQDFVGNLLQAVLIVIGVMLISLGVRTGLVVASLIPSAIVMSLLVMSFFGIGLDQMSLASLIIALGMLVDNAIVMSESVLVQMGEGKSARQAAIDSAAELRIPLLTSSLTTAAAFLPIYLAESTTGEYTAPLFKVVTITLLCSWVLSLTMIPLLCVAFLKVKKHQAVDAGGDAAYDTRFYRTYRGLLQLALRNRVLTLIGVAVVFVAAMALFRLVPVIFFPPNDKPLLKVELFLPTGTPLAATQQVVDQVESFLQDELLIDPQAAAQGQVGVTDWTTFIGAGAPRFVLSYGPEQSSPEYAILLVNANDREFVDLAQERLLAYCNQTFPDLRARISTLSNGAPTDNPIEVRIAGRDSDVIFEVVAQVQERLAEIPGTRRVSDNWGARSKKLRVHIRERRARAAGVTHQDIAISLQTLLSGIETTEYREGDKVIPVTLRSVGADRLDLSKLGSLNVFAQATGHSVPLSQVAEIEVAWQPANIRRRNRLRTVTVEAGLAPGVTAAEVNAQLLPWLEEQSTAWPRGTSWELGGESEGSSKANASIAEKLPIAGLIILLLLVGQFNSLRRPLIILITIPLGLIGVVVGLLVMQSSFGFMTLLGVISLAGIVINNAIVLIDRVDTEIAGGMDPATAIIDSAQRRLRPILLTTFTTLGGLIPLYLGGGPMWEPMAVAIMFGLVFATALTLGVVPVLYSLFFGIRFDDDASKPRISVPEALG